MRFFALIAAAGSGYRFGTELPKQYSLLSGKPVLQHSIERIASGFPLAMTYVVLAPDDQWFDATIGEQPGVGVLRCGGATRGASVRNALDAMSGVASDDWILVHDAVRPCVDRASLLRLQDEPRGRQRGRHARRARGERRSSVPDATREAGATPRSLRTEPRAGLWAAQTPHLFRYA